MGYYTPTETFEITIKKGVEKVNASLGRLIVSGILGGVYVSLGYLTYIRVAGSFSGELAGLGSFLGAAMFPLGLIGILIGGADLLTGNMLVVGMAWLNRKVTLTQLLYNWGMIALTNMIGAMLMAFFLGHVVGLTEGAYLQKTLDIAVSKAHVDFWPALLSGIGCNIFVGLGVWLCFAAKDFTAKVIAIWFPITAFAVIGFQHVVANMFVVSAAIFSGQSTVTWAEYFLNLAASLIGNGLGGALVMGIPLTIAHRPKKDK